MKVKKYLFMAIGVFIAFIIVAIGISARFSLSNITTAPYMFIEHFFTAWSLTLSAVATFIVAILALIAIYEGRRSYRLAILNQKYDKIEEWILNNAEGFYRVKETIRSVTLESKREQELESEHDSLEGKKGILEREMDTEEASKNERLEELIEINEKLIDVNKEMMAIAKRSSDYAEEGIKEMEKISAKLVRSNMTIMPIIQSTRDSELLKYFENYTNLINEKVKALEAVDLESSPNIFEEAINEIENTTQNLLWYIYHLRNKIANY